MRSVKAGPWSLAAVAILLGGMPLRAGEPKEEKETGEVRQFPYGSYIYHVAFSPDGKLVVTDDQVWDAATGKKIRALPLLPLKDRPYTPFQLAFSPDSRQVAIHRYNDLVLVEVATGKEAWTVELPPRKPYHVHVPSIAFTPDGKQLVTARNDEGIIRVWVVATGKEVRSFPYATPGGLSGAPLNSLGISADGKRLVIHYQEAGHKGGPVLLDLETGKELARHRVSSEEAWVHFSAPTPDGRHLIYAKKNGLHMIDVKTGEEVRRFEGVGVYAFHVACSPDGKRVAASVRPRKDVEEDWVQCWDVSSGKTVRVFKGHKGTVGGLVFSPDGKFILSADGDRTARLWRVDE
jgi:WD40 repeat protein